MPKKQIRREDVQATSPRQAVRRGLADQGATARLMRSKNPVERKEIRQMVSRIVRRFDPERIILFGSYARGDARPDSDVDLLIVLPFSGSRHEKQVEIRLALQDIRIPTDILVTTPEDFLWRKEVPGTIERPAAREGKLLYVRP